MDINQTEIKKEFWINQWEYLIKNFSSKTYGLSMYSPHILIDDIITEINENNFKNKDNRKFFYKKLNDYFKNDEVIKTNFNSIFKLLRANFETDKIQLLLHTCLKIKSEFQKGVYFDKNLELLNLLICNNDEINSINSEKIKFLSQVLIVEFIKKGYVLEDIKDFAKNVLDGFQMLKFDKTEILSTKFPHDIVSENNNETDEYYYKIRESINNLNLNDRIRALSRYYYKDSEIVEYLFVVEGLKGSVDIKIGNVTLYSLDKKKIIENDKYNEENILEKSTKETHNFIQAAVEVDYLMPKSSLAIAINKLENILDLITCHYNLKTPLEIDTSRYIIVKNGRSITSTFSRKKNDNFIKYHDSLNLNENALSLEKLINFDNIFQSKESMTLAISRIVNAVHWYSKAEQSTREEDKMLNYWIAIENLFNYEFDIKDDILKNNKTKIQLIQEIISSSHIFIFKYQYGWEFFNIYSHLILNNKRPDIPQDLINKSGLSCEGYIYLKDFVNSLEDLIRYEKDILYSQEMENILKFYTENKFALDTINSQIELIEDDILMIYRFRNLIVHNAHFDNALLPYYVLKIRNYSGYLIRNLLPKLNENNSTLSKEMINFYIEKEIFLKKLEENKYIFFEN